MVEEIYDVIIIGAGPIGIACAIECEKEKLNYIILEKGKVVNSLENYPSTMTFFSTPDRLEIGGLPFISKDEKPCKQEAIDYYTKVVKEWNVNVFENEEVVNVEKIDAGYKIFGFQNTYHSKKVIVATGYYDIPILMDVPGEELSKTRHYFQNPQEFKDSKVVVVGAANSAIDAAIECEKVGAEVVLVVRGAEVSTRVKPWVIPEFASRVKEEKIKVMYNSTVQEIFEDSIVLNTSEGHKIFENNYVLAMTGYKPNYPFLEKIGIQFEDSKEAYPMCTSENYETNMPGIYMAGVVCGGMNTTKFFIENSREHAEKIIQDIVSK